MYLKSLTLKNFGPFRNTNTINFGDESLVTFIRGVYESNPSRSNMAGKSSLVEAIGYLIFGEIRDRLKEVDLVHYGTDEMTVSGVLVLDGKEVTITRGRTRENKPILDIEGLKGTKTNKEKELQSLIGLDSKSFFQTYFFKQSDINGFMELAPAERKKLLQTWFNLGRWQEYELKAKARFSKANDELLKIESDILSLKAHYDSLKVEDDALVMLEIENRLKSLQDSKDRTLQFKLELERADNPEELFKSVQKLELELNSYKSKQSNFNRDYEGLQRKIVEANNNKAKAEESRSFIKEPSDGILEKLNISKSTLSAVVAKTSALNNEVKNKKELLREASCFSGTCPIDHKECDKGSRLPDYKKQLESLLVNFTTELNQAMDEYSAQQNIIKGFEANFRDVKAKENEVNNLLKNSDSSIYEQHRASLAENMKLISAQQDSLIIQLEDSRKKLSSLDPSKRLNLSKQITEELNLQSLLQSKLAELNSQIGRIKQIKETKSSLEANIKDKELKVIDFRKSVYRWKYILSVLGKDGIPSILIENSLSYIEDYTNLILESITQDMKVEFTTQKEVSTKETHCSVCGSPYSSTGNKCDNCGYGHRSNKVRDEVDIQIHNASNILSFNQLSGGGKVLVSLSLRLALSKLLSNNNPKQCQMLILDEVFGQLDSVNRDHVSKMIFNSLKNLMGFRQILVISHSELNDYQYRTIKIIRKEGYSVIE